MNSLPHHKFWFYKKFSLDKKSFFSLILFALCIFSVLVVTLGAYTRLVHAGLGCPDWPGCYGHLTWPTTSHDINIANQTFPEMPVDNGKTWPEMVHRYLAGLLGVGIFCLTLACYSLQPLHYLKRLTSILSILVVFQALLGMWTVTLKLWPQVVCLHLLGGFSTASLLFFGFLKSRHSKSNHQLATVSTQTPISGQGPVLLILWVFLGLSIIQICLGGWASANYAAMACVDFPTCQSHWLPAMDWQKAFVLWQSQGPNYLGGQLDGEARTAIHWTHRVFALIVWLFACGLTYYFYKYKRFFEILFLFIAINIQVVIGILNVFLSWPLFLALAHNTGALLLLMSVIFCLSRQYQLLLAHEPVNYFTSSKSTGAKDIGVKETGIEAV